MAAGAHIVGALTAGSSTANQTLGIIGTGEAGSFLYIIAILNLVALIGIVRVFRAMRGGELDEARLETHLQNRGLMNRILGRLTRTITRPGQMYPVGILFGLGFDTATEVALLVLAGTGAASGLPWYAIMVLPLLFACGMSLLDCLDGLFMSVAYDWAFLNPVRKVYYNISDHRAVGRGRVPGRDHRAHQRPARQRRMGQPRHHLDQRHQPQQRRLHRRRPVRRHLDRRIQLLAHRQGRRPLDPHARHRPGVPLTVAPMPRKPGPGGYQDRADPAWTLRGAVLEKLAPS